MPDQPQEFYVDFRVSVKVRITDPSVITRCVDNHDDEGNPQPDVKGGAGWRNMFYAITTAEQVVEHLAYNCIANGTETASQLEGWADLSAGAASMFIDRGDIDVEGVMRLDGSDD